MLLDTYLAVDKGTLKTGWDTRHNEALRNPKGLEVPIVKLLEGLEEYLYRYAQRYERTVNIEICRQ